MTAPSFLMRCPRCLQLHPWRAASFHAPPTERVQTHSCPHVFQCVTEIHHGHDGPLVPSCPQCTELANAVYAQQRHAPRPECLVCREVKRQGGTGCPGFKTSTENGWTVSKPDAFCRWRKLERMPPWCAGATEEEQAKFIGALPNEVRDKALIEARKANRQEGAEQKSEAPKAKKTHSNKEQTSLF